MNIKQSIIEYKKRRDAKKQARAEEYFEEIEKSKYLSNSYCPGCQFADNKYKDYCTTKCRYGIWRNKKNQEGKQQTINEKIQKIKEKIKNGEN